eukprot:TRINITY_DN3802_c0_g1_i1.p1 TRINITY_DN3802_c0_g1~~TRINITY_DN3802_c0_g1_i1.p1  ORF type:complete len:172 (+),score=31.57 TRINITY_DN3802_c0_g1_i1:87-602(+)
MDVPCKDSPLPHQPILPSYLTHHHHHHHPLCFFPHHHHHHPLCFFPHHHHHHHHSFSLPQKPCFTSKPHHLPSLPCPFALNTHNPGCFHNHFSTLPPQISSNFEVGSASPSLQDPNLGFSDSGLQEELAEELDEADEEPVYVLTDEWMEFFTKSEAKRRSDKKKSKKKGGK